MLLRGGAMAGVAYAENNVILESKKKENETDSVHINNSISFDFLCDIFKSTVQESESSYDRIK
ncbi:hypothetical protein FACS1894201_09780 [Bacteroidia bacterium]|nr:hypothetical protein FACS1894201_09780 [Bacteroidia bacterium]